MVSLRYDPQFQQIGPLRVCLRLAGGLLCGLAAGLLALAIAGAIWHANPPSQSLGQESLRQYIRALRAGSPFELTEATQRIHRGTTHSIDRRIAVTENWLQWALGRLYPPLSRTQNPQRLLAGGLTDCSERSQILKTLAEEAGCQCRFVGLSGHVVLEVRVGEKWCVADPDYGVVYSVPMAALESESGRRLIDETLSAAGYAPATIDQYRQIVHSAGDNVVLPVGSALSPRLDFVERACDALAVLLPLGGLAVGTALILGAPRRNDRGAQSRSSGTPRA